MNEFLLREPYSNCAFSPQNLVSTLLMQTNYLLQVKVLNTTVYPEYHEPHVLIMCGLALLLDVEDILQTSLFRLHPCL